MFAYMNNSLRRSKSNNHSAYDRSEYLHPETIELKSGLSAQQADRQILLARRASGIGARSLAFYLADMADRGTYQELGYKSIEFYAEQRHDMRPSTTREYVLVGRSLQALPGLDLAFRRNQLPWSHVREIARVAVPQTELKWLEWAKGRTAQEIASQAQRRQKGDLPADPDRRRIHSIWFDIHARLSARELDVWNKARAQLEAESGHSISDHELMITLAQFKLLADGLDEAHAATEAPKEAAATLEHDLVNSGTICPQDQRSPPTPPSMRAKVLRRDNFACACCGSDRNLAAHHLHWRQFGGKTELDNLVSLCEDCHSLVHERLLTSSGAVGDGVHFVNRDGQPVVRPNESGAAALAAAAARDKEEAWSIGLGARGDPGTRMCRQ